MAEETEVVEETTPPVDPTDEIRGIIFGTEEERETIFAKRKAEEEAKEAEEKAKEVPAEVPPEPAPEAIKKPKIKPTPKPKPIAPEPTEPEPEPEPTKPKPPKKLTTEELIRLNADASREAVVAGVREAVEQTRPRPQAPPPESKLTADKATLPPDIRRNIDALRVLAQTKPGEFSDIESKAIKFWDQKSGELVKYRKAWEKDHPDDEFDMDAEEHSAWMDEHEPYVSEEDLEFAREETIRRRVRSEIQSEVEPIRRRLAEREAEEQSAPVIVSTVNGSLKDIVGALNPELKDLSDEDIGAHLHTKDPVAAHVLVRTAPSYVPLISETIRIFAGKPYDANNQLHVTLDRYAAGLEQSLAGMAPEQSIITHGNTTLRFATRAQIARVAPAERNKYWTVNRDVILNSLRRDWATATTQSYNEYKSLVDAVNGKQTPAPNPKPAPKAAVVEPSEEEPEEQEAKPRSPSVRSSSPAPPPVPPDDPSLKKTGQFFFEKAGW
jgi:hypothetical protein